MPTATLPADAYEQFWTASESDVPPPSAPAPEATADAYEQFDALDG